jgi:hypothetical protein
MNKIFWNRSLACEASGAVVFYATSRDFLTNSRTIKDSLSSRSLASFLIWAITGSGKATFNCVIGFVLFGISGFSRFFNLYPIIAHKKGKYRDVYYSKHKTFVKFTKITTPKTSKPNHSKGCKGYN